jgi:hypothetical protein
MRTLSFPFGASGNVCAPKAKSRSNWAFRFRRMTGQAGGCCTRPSPGVSEFNDSDSSRDVGTRFQNCYYAASGPSAVGPVSGKRFLAAISDLQGLCRGLIVRQSLETSRLAGFLTARKVTFGLPAVPIFNVTGQCEGSVKRAIKIVDR